MTTALRMIKEEFGPEAVILSVRDLEKGKGFLGLMDKGGLEVTAAIDTPLDEPKPQSEENARRSPRREPSPVSVTLSSVRRKRPAPPEPAPVRLAEPIPPALPSAPVSPASPAAPAPEFSAFFQQMIDHDIKEKIALDILDKISNMPNGGHVPADRLVQGMTRIFRERGIASLNLEPEAGRQRRISFMGPAGVGKTTTIAKLTAFHSIRGRNVGVIALDDDRICALRKLEIFAKIINVPMELAIGGDGMQRALRRFRNTEIVYIDTPGCSMKNARIIRWIRKELGVIPDIQNLLLISAAAKEKDIAAFVRIYGSVPVHGLIVTKIDESLTYGNLLNYLYRAPMPLSYFADGQRIPEDIRPASPQMLAGLFVDAEKSAAKPAVPAIVSPPSDQNVPPRPEEGDACVEIPYAGLHYYGGRS